MRFLALSPLAALALLAGVLALVLTAYLLKPGRRRIAVSSFTLWAKVLSHQRRVASRWRWWVSVLLAGLIGGALALALARPELAGVGGRSQRLVLLLDNSPSMAARTQDGRTRWQHAMAQARALVAQLGGASEVMVLDTMGRAPLAGYEPPSQAWRRIGDLPLMSAGRPVLPHLPEGRDARRMHWFTDGVALPPAPDGARVHSVYEPADNVGITAFEARLHPADRRRVSALVQVSNGGTRAARVRLAVSGPEYRHDRELLLAAGASAQASLDLSGGGAGLYRAQVRAAGDALPTDDEAYALVPPHGPRRVLLVSADGARLRDSLRVLAGVQLSVTPPGGYRGGGHDAYIFDGFVPPQLPSAGALLFAAATDASRRVGNAVVTAWDGLHPLTQGVAWGDLRLRGAVLTHGGGSGHSDLVRAAALEGVAEGVLVTAGTQPPFERAQATGTRDPSAPLTSGEQGVSDGSGNTGAVVTSGIAASAVAATGASVGKRTDSAPAFEETGTGGVRWIRVGFALDDSNFTLQPGFPVFLGNAIDWLSQPPQPLTRHLGSIAVPLMDARVRDAGGRSVESFAEPGGTRFEAPVPGVYTVQSSTERVQVVANVVDPAFTRINDSALPPQVLTRETGDSARYVPRTEFWTLLLVLAAVLVLAEWAGFTRKVTV